MDLTDRLISDFVKATAPKEDTGSHEYTAHGVVTAVGNDGTASIMFDGGTVATPCKTAVTVSVGDKVIVTVKDRQATVTSNVSNNTVNADFLEGGDAYFSGTLTVDWRDNIKVKVGSSNTDPLVLETTYNDEKTLIWPHSIGVYRNGGRSYVTLDIDNGYDWSSDARIKERIRDIDPLMAMGLRPVSFYFTEGHDNREKYGFVAQEVYEVIPDVVTDNNGGCLGLSYHQLIAPTLALAQHNNREIETLKQKIADLERRLADVEAKHNSVSAEE